LRIPAAALSAYRKAEKMMATADPGCGLSWNLLAGIGRLESTRATTEPSAVQAVSARTPAPKKMPSATWLRFAADGDGDGRSDAQNPFDATLATAKHLCSTGMNFRNQAQALTALMRYNDSMPFARNVLGWAAAGFAVLTAYVRELGRANGLPADFSGPMAKPQRMAVLTGAAVLAVAEPLWGGQGGLLRAALWLVCLGSLATALRRAVRQVRALRG
jgi:membrane-bound lytic murein transglycosylase B